MDEILAKKFEILVKIFPIIIILKKSSSTSNIPPTKKTLLPTVVKNVIESSRLAWIDP